MKYDIVQPLLKDNGWKYNIEILIYFTVLIYQICYDKLQYDN
jgi:hypothetical protein